MSWRRKDLFFSYYPLLSISIVVSKVVVDKRQSELDKPPYYSGGVGMCCVVEI
jgi:hypothetical protein